MAKMMNRRKFVRASVATGVVLISGCGSTRQKTLNTMEGQVRNNEPTSVRGKVIDLHLHIGGKGNSSSCKTSKKFLFSCAYPCVALRKPKI